mmetsp:Transcript_3453/g.9446  ORF Transcript_3453/g.9446 Transcript_3453/m.9446 type:complete len:399 (-) Transcript_3453:1394-2590(-)
MAELADVGSDLVELLRAPRADVRGGAAAAVAAYSNDPRARHAVFPPRDRDSARNCEPHPSAHPLMKALLRVSSDAEVMIARSALSALTNFAIEPSAVALLFKLNAAARMFEALLDGEEHKSLRTLDSLRAGLLANMTRHPEAAQQMFERSGENVSSYARELSEQRMRRVFQRLFTEPERFGAKKELIDALESVAMLGANLAAIEPGRGLLLDGGSETSIVAQSCSVLMRSRNPTRRLGAALLLRNVAVDERTHAELLSWTDSGDVIVAALVPLVYHDDDLPRPIEMEELSGAHPVLLRAVELAKMNKAAQYEKVLEVRVALAEFLLAMCKSAAGRTALRDRKAYPVLRCAHWHDRESAVGDILHQVVDRTELLDEDPEALPVSGAKNLSASSHGVSKP